MIRPILRFVVIFAVIFGALLWLFDGTGPVLLFNEFVGRLTMLQARTAGMLLTVFGEPVSIHGASLTGPGFSCVVDTGCNAMSAVVLVTAGLLGFPGVTWRSRFLGMAVLLPVILLLNIARIAGLYWTGAYLPQWFGPAHVYVWQTVVIAVTVLLWLVWLSWNSRSRGVSS